MKKSQLRDLIRHHIQESQDGQDMESGIQKASSDLMHATDGPVNKITVIHRALELAEYKKYSLDVISNALLEALEYIETNGDIDSNEY